VIIGFLAGLAWGVALSIVLVVVGVRSMRKNAMHAMFGFFKSTEPKARVETFDALFARYCVHCGNEMAVPTTCMCDEARAERQSNHERVHAILDQLAHPKGSS
jgi:hypothetical protein